MENERRVPENLKKRLALAVRSIQWSYGIFWSTSKPEDSINRVLEWGDGYYNGDIKTRKTIQSMDFNADQIGLRRSEQLRELYVSLSIGESNPQAKRPSAALSPEDLTDTEWYYMVCMSFVFDIGQGLPGRTLATNRFIWICNAPHANSIVFTRSLLAKSASVQTVVCFPFLGGVVELGTTEQVPEDHSLIHFVRTSFLEILNPMDSWRFKAHHVPHSSSDDLACDLFNHDFEEPQSVPVIGALSEISPRPSSERFEAAAFPESSFPVERANTVTSRARVLQHIDNDFSNWTNASECVSEASVEPSPILEDGGSLEFTESATLDDPANDHYHNILTAVLRTSSQLIVGQHFRNASRASSFAHWKNGEFSSLQRTCRRTAQKLLKKILFEVPRMCEKGLVSSENSVRKKSALRPEADDIMVNHKLSERRRREKINERLTVLKSMIPLADKIDKVSALDETIEYVKELERRVDELEPCSSVDKGESRPTRKSLEEVERTSDNCGTSKRLPSRKRKAYDSDGDADETDSTSSALTVRLNGGNVQIEMRCAWREGLLLDVINEAKNLRLETHSVRSSTVDGILTLTMTSKFTGTTFASAATIKHALERFAMREGSITCCCWRMFLLGQSMIIRGQLSLFRSDYRTKTAT